MISNFHGKIRPFTPAGKSECLCGSGEKFKRCCAENLPGFDIGRKTRAAAAAGDYRAALIAARSDVTQYTIWHKTTTAPILNASRDSFPENLYMLNIDVEALSDYVELLGHYYNRLDRADEFPVVLERVRSNIDHPRWDRKIGYFHAIHSLGKTWNDEAGRKELKKLGSMDEETDVEILQLYVDLFGKELGFSRRQILVERIVRLARNPAERLHYRCLSAINLWMVGDQQEAIKGMLSATHDYAEARDENDESAYALNHYASAFVVLGQIQQNKQMLDHAVTLFRKLVARDEFTAAGVASAYCQLGDALRYLCEWKEAQEVYLIALAKYPLDIIKVFLSECLLYLDGPKAARNLLSTVEISTLTTGEAIDYAFTLAQVAIESGCRETLVEAEQTLRSQKIAEPYFQQRQNALLFSVIDTLRSGPSEERIAKTRDMLSKGISALFRYVKCEPNFMGIGLNVGKMIEDCVGSRAPTPEKLENGK